MSKVSEVNFLILHGIGASSKSNWYPWLKFQLEGLGAKVYIPDLPNPRMPKMTECTKLILDNWIPNTKSVVIGHSVGGVVAMGLLEDCPPEVIINSLYLIATPKGPTMPEHQGIFEKEINYDLVRSKVEKTFLIYSDNDPYTPLESGDFLRDKLSGNLMIFPGEAHFNIRSNPKYNEFPKLLEIIKQNA